MQLIIFLCKITIKVFLVIEGSLHSRSEPLQLGDNRLNDFINLPGSLEHAVNTMYANTGFACKNDPKHQSWENRFHHDPHDDRNSPPSAPTVPAR